MSSRSTSAYQINQLVLAQSVRATAVVIHPAPPKATRLALAGLLACGSLTQVAFPLLFVDFLRKREDGRRRDVFAAMVCLWWSAIGLLATAIYCADSRAGKLMLLDGLTGQESEGHDWYNLLDRWGLLEHDTQIARWMRAIAFIMCVASIAVAFWSALLLPREQPHEASES